jgi:hypothetical protein
LPPLAPLPRVTPSSTPSAPPAAKAERLPTCEQVAKDLKGTKVAKDGPGSEGIACRTEAD